jgi:hypothetical protein
MDRPEALFGLGSCLHRVDTLLDELARALLYMEAHLVLGLGLLARPEDVS